MNCSCKKRRREEWEWEGSKEATCSCVRVVKCASIRSWSSVVKEERSLLMWNVGFME